MPRIYLDNSATTPVLPEVAQEVLRVMTADFANPSSLHSPGIDAAMQLRRDRKVVADALRVSPEEVYFTSGGTESNNTVLFGVAEKFRRQKGRIIVSAIEHDAVLSPAKTLAQDGWDVVFVKADIDGKVSSQAIQGALTDDTVLVCLMLVNNETGAVQDVAAVSRMLKQVGSKALLHCDAVQAFGKIAVHPRELGCDFLSVSAHKLHGPKGIGALYCKKEVRLPSRALGGGQENGFRSGTEATELIAGFAKAVELCADLDAARQRVAALNRQLREGLAAIDNAQINSPEDGLEYILNVSFLGIRSEVLLRALDAKGICISAGSACSKGNRSRVLTAQGLSAARIDSAVRISFSRLNTPDEIAVLLDALKEAAATLKRGKV